MAPLCEWQCEGRLLHSCLALHGDPQSHLQVQYTTSALQMTFPQLQCVTDMSFWLSSFRCLFVALVRNGYLHSALCSGTQTEHLIPNRSWHEDIRHGECSWTLTVTTAVDVSISALYLMCLVRVVTCTAKKETRPPTHTYTHTLHSPLNASHDRRQCVCETYP